MDSCPGNFDWDALSARTMAPPYVPRVKGASDLSNFDQPNLCDGPPQLKYVDPRTGWDKDFAGKHLLRKHGANHDDRLRRGSHVKDAHIQKGRQAPD